MNDRSMKRALAVALLSASAVVTFDGCTAARRVSDAQATGADPAPQKEYQWKDMSTGKSFFNKKPAADPPAN